MIDTKALKQKILQLAIQGKLVPQNPDDEPASVLLKRIRAEKQRLIKEGKIKKDKSDSVIFKGDDNRHYEKIGNNPPVCIEEKLPFEIPNNWAWARMITIVDLLSGRDLEPSQYNSSNEGIPYITGASNFEKNKLIINRWTNKPVTISKIGDLLITCKGTIGAMAYNWVGNIHIARQVMAISSYLVHIKYVELYLKNKIRQLEENAKSFIPGISRDDIKLMLIPLPPLAEQERIVKRVEELFAYIDTIDNNQAELEKLYDDLKKRVLDLAIQGKLVSQEPSDEPASVLLEKIRAEKKAKLGKKYVESYIYKGDDNCYYEHIDGIAEDKPLMVPFDLPDGWAWAKLLDLGEFSSGKTPDMSEPKYWENGTVQWFTSKDMKTKYLADSQLKITELAAKNMTLYPAGTLLWVVRSGILKSRLPLCVLSQAGTINQDIKAYKIFDMRMSDYIYFMLKGFENLIISDYVKRITTVHSLKFDELINRFLIPLPPLAEQQRIVDKINEIIANL